MLMSSVGDCPALYNAYKTMQLTKACMLNNQWKIWQKTIRFSSSICVRYVNVQYAFGSLWRVCALSPASAGVQKGPRLTEEYDPGDWIQSQVRRPLATGLLQHTKENIHMDYQLWRLYSCWENFELVSWENSLILLQNQPKWIHCQSKHKYCFP